MFHCINVLYATIINEVVLSSQQKQMKYKEGKCLTDSERNLKI